MAKILIVDDQPTYLRMLYTILTQHKHDVTKVNNAIEALDALKNTKFDLLLTDAIMPGPTGFDLVSTIRSSEELKDLPVIMLTSKREQKDVQKGILIGVNDYVIKPVEPIVLIEKIAAVLAKANQSKLPSVARVQIAACWQDTTTVTEVSESGMSLESNFAVSIGFPIRIKSDIFKHLGVREQTLTAFECTADKANEGTFQIKVIYADPTAQEVQLIRNWINSHLSKKAS